MPTECITNPLQRELADSIIRMEPLDELRILLACGAKANEPVTQGLRPLHYAVWQRYIEAACLLITRGGDINARDECGYSALHLSAEHGYPELVQLLLNRGAKVDFREDNGEQFPRTQLCDEPLRLAIRNRHYECARLLLEHGADPNKRYFFGAEINLVSPQDIEFMRLLLNYGAHPDTRDRAGLTPLMKAARLPNGIDAVLLLISFGADVNGETDERHDYRTVLHYAVLSGNHTTVQLLIRQGARTVFPIDYRKPTPLDLAILKGDPDLVRILLDAGSEVNRFSRIIGSPLHIVCSNRTILQGLRLLRMRSDSADVNASSPIIGSPLHVACSDNIPQRLPILRMLLEHGADPNLVIDTDGGPPLRPVLAEYLSSNDKPCPAVLELLLLYGAKVIMKTQFRDPLGLLNSLQNVADQPRLFVALVDAAEGFDPCMIRRSSQITEQQRALLLMLARQPLSLCHQSRLFIRRQLGTNLLEKVQELEIPKTLKQYLLYEIR